MINQSFHNEIITVVISYPKSGPVDRIQTAMLSGAIDSEETITARPTAQVWLWKNNFQDPSVHNRDNVL